MSTGTVGNDTRLPQTALGRCPVCAGVGYLTQRGLMRAHDVLGGTVLSRCAGSGQPMTERVR